MTDQIAADSSQLARTGVTNRCTPEVSDGTGLATRRKQPGWVDGHGRCLFPLDFPDLVCDLGVFAPTPCSLFVWRYLFGARIGQGQRCLDVGCGSGLQAIQLARNGAAHVHAIDIDERAVRNTMTNAQRAGFADRISAEQADLYEWIPSERYGIITASLYQTPVNKYEKARRDQLPDYWGRNLLDQLIARLPDMLTSEGSAYIIHASIIGMQRTVELLVEYGLETRVIDFGFLEFHELHQEQKQHILRVEEISDAFHLTLGKTDTIVLYLLQVTHQKSSAARSEASCNR